MTFLEVGLLILLSVGLVYMVSINKKLKMLKSGGDGFKAVVIELNRATENAKEAIQGLKLTVRDAEHGLDGNLKQARSVTEELKYLLAQAETYSDGLQAGNRRNIPAPSENLRNIRQPVVPQNRAKNFADQTLEKVARQKQSLPNPIVHGAGNKMVGNLGDRQQSARPEQNLGHNIPTEHREMALQAREQALKSIAAKNIEQNIQRPSAQSAGAARPNVNRPVPQNRGAMGQGGNQANLAQPNLAQSNPARVNRGPSPVARQQAVSRPIPAQNQGARGEQRGQMSLSDMVGRHAELERQNFTQVAEPEPTASDNNSPRGGAGKRQSLFDKLSKTR